MWALDFALRCLSSGVFPPPSAHQPISNPFSPNPWPLRLSYCPPAKGCGEALRPAARPASATARPTRPTPAQPARGKLWPRLRPGGVQRAPVSQEPESGSSESIHPRVTLVRKGAVLPIPSAASCLRILEISQGDRALLQQCLSLVWAPPRACPEYLFTIWRSFLLKGTSILAVHKIWIPLSCLHAACGLRWA